MVIYIPMLKSIYYADGDEITTIVFDSTNNTIDVVITNTADKSGASPVHAQYVMNGNELFIIESRQVNGNIRNVILYYDGTISKFAVEETNTPGEPQLPIDIITTGNANWDSMFASSVFSNIFGEFDNSSGNFTFTGN